MFYIAKIIIKKYYNCINGNKINMNYDELYMEMALSEAKKVNSFSIPIGAVLVHSKTGIVLTKNNNNSFSKNDPFSHAEIKVLKEAAFKIGQNYLEEYSIYITIEPCLTCFSLIKSYGIKRIIFGAENSKYGFSNFIKENKIPKIQITKNIKSDESIFLLQTFFKELRTDSKN